MKTFFRVKETFVTIVCDEGFVRTAEDAIFEARGIIESKIEQDPFFSVTYEPYPASGKDDPLIRRMCEASALAGVGPMAGVAGAVAEHAVTAMRDAGAAEAIVENGGDIAFLSPERKAIGIYADHPVFRDLAFMVKSDGILGICSSSEKIGPSVSLGGSNICTVFSPNVVLADCCATALGNLVKGEDTLAGSCERVGAVEGVDGCVACCDGKIAMFGDVPELVRADCSRLL